MFIRGTTKLFLVGICLLCFGCGKAGAKVARSAGRAFSKRADNFPQANPRSAVSWQRRINEWSRPKPCSRCVGYKQLTCSRCNGTGTMLMPDVWGNVSVQVCPMCIGQGRPSFMICPNCNGSGQQ